MAACHCRKLFAIGALLPIKRARQDKSQVVACTSESSSRKVFSSAWGPIHGPAHRVKLERGV